MSKLDQSMTKVKFDMNEVKENLTKVAESLTKISDDNNARDRKLDDFLKNLNTGLHERDKRTDDKIERMERQIDPKIEEKFPGLDTRISAIERNTTSVGHRRLGDTQGRWGPTPTDCKAVLRGFKTESKEQDVKAIVMDSIKATGMKEEHTVDYQAIPITHVFAEFEDTRTRGQIRQIGEHAKIRPGWKKDQNIYGSGI